MADNDITLHFTHEGISYKGWATASEKLNDDGEPKSYHVVLNKVFFGNISKQNSGWINDEDRPQDLTDITGINNSTAHANNIDELPNV